jgi:hypothetical protein
VYGAFVGKSPAEVLRLLSSCGRSPDQEALSAGGQHGAHMHFSLQARVGNTISGLLAHSFAYNKCKSIACPCINIAGDCIAECVGWTLMLMAFHLCTLSAPMWSAHAWRMLKAYPVTASAVASRSRADW